MRGAIILLTLILAAPASAEVSLNNPNDSTPTTLYFHLIDGHNDFPINTQLPSDDWSVAAGKGLATHSLSCVPAVPGSSLTSKAWHTWYGYSSPSEVEYDFEEDGLPRVHPERGFSYDVQLDTAVEPVLYWYLETQAGTDEANKAPIVVPNVVVRATMRTGSAIGVGAENYEQGEILAQGQSDPSTLAADATQGPAEYIGGEQPTYKFRIPLNLAGDKIPSTTGFNVRIDVWMDNPACDGASGSYVTPNLVKLHTSPGQRPSMELATTNPVRIDAIHPQFVGDDMVIHVLANSPWGSYDVDERAGISLDIEGPSEPKTLDLFVTDHIHLHGPTAHFQPLAVAGIWPIRDECANEGLYTVSFSAWNDQHTAQATGSSTFEMGKSCTGGITCYIDDAGREICGEPPTVTGGKDSPGVGMFVVLCALAAIAMFTRGRQTS